MGETWQSIATAPRAHDVLLLYPSGRPFLGRKLGLEQGGAIQGGWWSSIIEEASHWETLIGFIGEPTHWAHLPEKSATAQSQETPDA